jgi:4-alpha-glucanotransferase
LLGDLPIFVAADSCDVWAHRELFSLNPDGRPSKVSGCPPDYFAKKGQLWGHPQYRWENHKKTGFAWWTSRFANELGRFDGLRVDHFIGFHRTWAIPGDAKDGRRGKWMLSPGKELFAAVAKKIGPAPIIAEDLGVLTPEAEKLRDDLDMPGMRVTQFGFNGASYHLPHRFVKHCVAYTGTHDNNTVRGWFAGTSGDERSRVLAYLETKPAQVPQAMIHALLRSTARTVIFPVQDVLGLGPADRMNMPGTDTHNWRWRLKPGQLTPAVAKELARLTTLYERNYVPEKK